MSGIAYTFVGAYAISVLTDVLVPDSIRHPVKATAITLWSRHTTQGKISQWLGQRMLIPARVLVTNPYFMGMVGAGVGLVVTTNVMHYTQRHVPEYTYGSSDQHGPQRWGVGLPFQQPRIEDDHPWLI